MGKGKGKGFLSEEVQNPLWKKASPSPFLVLNIRLFFDGGKETEREKKKIYPHKPISTCCHEYRG